MYTYRIVSQKGLSTLFLVLTVILVTNFGFSAKKHNYLYYISIKICFSK